LWVLEYEDDLDADFLAIYGIDLESASITGPRFFKLATRLPAFEGVFKTRLDNMRVKQEEASKPMSPAEYIRKRKAEDPNFKAPLSAVEMDVMQELIEME
jgi:hypothetical protein